MLATMNAKPGRVADPLFDVVEDRDGVRCVRLRRAEINYAKGYASNSAAFGCVMALVPSDDQTPYPRGVEPAGETVRWGLMPVLTPVPVRTSRVSITYRVTSSSFVREDGKTITVYAVMTGDGPGGQAVYRCLRESDAVRWIKNSILKPSLRSHIPKRDGTPGVWWDARLSKWRAAIWHRRVRTYLGCFDTEIEAIAARLAAEGSLPIQAD